MRLLLVDDHPMIRRGIREILTEDHVGTVVGEAADGDAALAALERERWDIVVLDLSMPGRSGVELIGEIKQRFPRAPILVLSVQPEEHYALRSLRAGASGYLSKDADAKELIAAVAKLAAGGRYVTERMAEQLAALVLDRPVEAPHELLSEREFDVLRGIAAGKTVGELARELDLSVKTVTTYRARMLEKLRLSTNAEVMRYALDHSIG